AFPVRLSSAHSGHSALFVGRLGKLRAPQRVPRLQAQLAGYQPAAGCQPAPQLLPNSRSWENQVASPLVPAAPLYAPRAAHSASNRSRVTNDFCVPAPSVDSAAYRLARATASISAVPSARKHARLPMNASPAPVVSTGRTANAGTWVIPSGPPHSAPFAPNVTITRRTPPSSNFRAHARASSRLCTGIPVSASASVSLGIT